MFDILAPALPDVVDAGRVMAELDDWRTIAFALLFVIVVLLIGFMTSVFWSLRLATKSATGMADMAAALSANNITLARNEQHATQAVSEVRLLAQEVRLLTDQRGRK